MLLDGCVSNCKIQCFTLLMQDMVRDLCAAPLQSDKTFQIDRILERSEAKDRSCQREPLMSQQIPDVRGMHVVGVKSGLCAARRWRDLLA